MHALVASYHVSPEKVDEMTQFTHAMISSTPSAEGFKKVVVLTGSKGE